MDFDDKLGRIVLMVSSTSLLSIFSSVYNTLQAQSESAFKLTNDPSLVLSDHPVFRVHFLRIPWVFS